jgi:hypothetical protein
MPSIRDENDDVSAPSEGTFLPRLVAEWNSFARPLLLVDEIRRDASEPGVQITSFFFLGTDTRTACAFGDESAEVRDRLSQTAQETLIKGASLYGSRKRASHEGFREYVRRSFSRCTALTVTTSSAVTTRYTHLAPGGIRGVRADAPGSPPIDFRGRELVPLLNSLKVVALHRGYGPVEVDVIIDRSKMFGLDPASYGLPADQWLIFEPDTFNIQADGSPASVICPSRFRLICPPKRSAVRDLMLLPDAAAYLLQAHETMSEEVTAVMAGEDFVVKDVDLSALAESEAARAAHKSPAPDAAPGT